MSESPTKLLEDRIAALIQRVKTLAAERDDLQRESEVMKERLESRERDNARLRTVLDEAVRDLRQE
jgi:outer membrane murein-binding lipoprotein Lpp